MVTLASRPGHTGPLLRLAGPLAITQLAQVAMGTTDTIFLGGISTDALAAGGLGAMLFITVLVVLQGVLSAVSVLMSGAIGAGQRTALPGLYWSGMSLCALLTVPAWVLFSYAEPLLLLVQEPSVLAHDTGTYLHVLRWGLPGGLIGMGLIRAVLPALGAGAMLLWVALPGAVVNAGLAWVLIHGAGPIPGFGMAGAAAATALVVTGMAVALLALIHRRASLRDSVRWQRPTPALLRRILTIGIPVAGIAAVETGLFLGIGLLVATLGPVELAGEQVALNVVTLSFMVPLALAQAAQVRVAGLRGAGDRVGARRAGWTAVALGAVTEAVPALMIAAAPAVVVGWYLPSTSAAAAVGVALLSVFLFQIIDGIQCAAAGALRGYADTRVPFGIAAAGYWGVGFPLAWVLSHAGWGALGAWYGIGAGLAFVAAALCWRYSVVSARASSSRVSSSEAVFSGANSSDH